MPRKSNPRALVAAFLLVSAALSVVLLAVRNLYDDELSSVPLVKDSIRNIVHLTSETNVHPPGMYVLAHLAYLVVPSIRWINLFPAALLYAGLALFLFEVTPLFAQTRSRVCLLLLATLHPQLLMWGTSFRWYGWWTGIALIVLTVALQPRKSEPLLSVARALTLGVLLACLFYLNYITILFAFALGVAMALRYRNTARPRLLFPVLLSLVVFFALVAPQIPTMLKVHLPQSENQRSGLPASFLRLLQSIATSEAYLPWHPLAILSGLLFIMLCVVGLIAILRMKRSPLLDVLNSSSSLAAITLFSIVFFFLVAVTRLGGKPRNGLLLIPTLAVVIAWIVSTLRPRLQSAAILFFALWSAVGIAHLLGRYGLTKASMNDRPELVVSFVQQTSGTGCSVVITYDPAVAYALTHPSLPRVLVISPFDEGRESTQALPPDDCAKPTLYVVQSYWGDPVFQKVLAGELRIATEYIQGQPGTRFFDLDPDAARKRQLARLPLLGRELAPAALLPDYRYAVTTGPIDRASLDPMRQHMPHFTGSSEAVSDQAMPGAN